MIRLGAFLIKKPNQAKEEEDHNANEKGEWDSRRQSKLETWRKRFPEKRRGKRVSDQPVNEEGEGKNTEKSLVQLSLIIARQGIPVIITKRASPCKKNFVVNSRQKPKKKG